MTIVMGLKPQGREVLRTSIDGDDPRRPGCIGTMNLQIILIPHQRLLLESSHPKNTCQSFLPEKIPESKSSRVKSMALGRVQ